MPGPVQPWDQPEDPRDETVDLPRIDLASHGNGSVQNGNGRAGYPRDLAGEQQSRNGHGPAATGRPGRLEPPGQLEPPGRREPPGQRERQARPGPDVAGDPYARPGRDVRPVSFFGPTASSPGLPRPVPAAAEPAADAQPSELTEPPARTQSIQPAVLPPTEIAPHSGTVQPTGIVPPETVPPETVPPETVPPETVPPTGALQAADSAAHAAAELHAQADVPMSPASASADPYHPQVATASAVPDAAPTPTAQAAASVSHPEPGGRRVAGDQRGRPGPGSLSDLRSRLDQLPDGHPSSPYEDDGAAKPLPHRLKQLELGLPAPERDAGDGTPRIDLSTYSASHPEDTSHGSQQRLDPAEHANDDRAADQLSAGSGLAGDEYHADLSADSDVESREAAALPERPAQSAEIPAGSLPSIQDGASRSDARPSAWEDPYALPASGKGSSGADHRGAQYPGPGMAAEPTDTERRVTKDPLTQPYQVSRQAELPSLPLRPGSADRQPRSVEHDFVPFGAGGTRPRVSTSKARDTGRPDARQLGTDHNELVARLLAAGRAAEGQSAFGSYGQSGLTPAIRRVAAQLDHGGLAPGSEADTLKSADRLSAKLARLITRHPDLTAEELAAGIVDVVRYAFTFEPDYYAEGTWLVHRKFKALGFNLEARRNRWESPEYKGVWTCWRDPAHELCFEVQFHTFSSWDVIVTTHQAYLAITDPATPPAERARLRARQVGAAAAAKAPAHCAEIADLSRESR